jgi:pentatricopeptide repeat protein
MVGEFWQTKNKRVQPDVQLFENVIKAFTAPECVSQSDALRVGSQLRKMWSLYEETGANVRPQASTYKHVIIGYKKAGMPHQADSLLREMQKKNVAKPTKELIQTVMNAWHDSHLPEKQKHINALRLLMNDSYIFGKKWTDKVSK